MTHSLTHIHHISPKLPFISTTLIFYLQEYQEMGSVSSIANSSKLHFKNLIENLQDNTSSKEKRIKSLREIMRISTDHSKRFTNFEHY